MNRRFQLLGALLRKDFRLFWLFALLNFSLIVALQFPAIIAQLGALGRLLPIVILLATGMLTLAVFHEDAMVSLKHDWLTRPIPGLVLLLAKCVFVVLAIIAPAVLGGIASNLHQGHSVAESVLAGVASGASASTLNLNLLIMVIAAVTANVRQAVVVILAGFVSLVVRPKSFSV